MSKKPENYGKIGVKQYRLQIELNEHIESYIAYRKDKANGNATSRPITIKELRKKQTEINELRRTLGLYLINQIQGMNWKLKFLKI